MFENSGDDVTLEFRILLPKCEHGALLNERCSLHATDLEPPAPYIHVHIHICIYTYAYIYIDRV